MKTTHSIKQRSYRNVDQHRKVNNTLCNYYQKWSKLYWYAFMPTNEYKTHVNTYNEHCTVEIFYISMLVKIMTIRISSFLSAALFALIIFMTKICFLLSWIWYTYIYIHLPINHRTTSWCHVLNHSHYDMISFNNVANVPFKKLINYAMFLNFCWITNRIWCKLLFGTDWLTGHLLKQWWFDQHFEDNID